jgi:hypothetical protein
LSSEAESFVADRAMRASHLGGQSSDYFQLLSILCKRRNDVRRWCERVRAESGAESILGENMDLAVRGKA